MLKCLLKMLRPRIKFQKESWYQELVLLFATLIPATMVFAGLVVAGYPADPPVENPRTDITLDGKVFLNNTDCCGLLGYDWFGSPERPLKNGTVRITGELITDRNVYYGVEMAYGTNISIVLDNGSSSGKSNKGSSGSLTACDNGKYDIYNEGDGSFEGTDYTCNSTLGNQDLLPVCKSCPKCSHSLQSTEIAGVSISAGSLNLPVYYSFTVNLND